MRGILTLFSCSEITPLAARAWVSSWIDLTHRLSWCGISCSAYLIEVFAKLNSSIIIYRNYNKKIQEIETHEHIRNGTGRANLSDSAGIGPRGSRISLPGQGYRHQANLCCQSSQIIFLIKLIVWEARPIQPRGIYNVLFEGAARFSKNSWHYHHRGPFSHSHGSARRQCAEPQRQAVWQETHSGKLFVNFLPNGISYEPY